MWTTLLGTINGIPADLFWGRVILGTAAIVAFVLAIRNMNSPMSLMELLPSRSARVAHKLYVFLLVWIGTIQLYGAVFPYLFPNPSGIRIALQYGFPLLLLWPPLAMRMVQRSGERALRSKT